MMNVDARDIKSAADVKPVGRTDYALITEEEDLAACKRIDPTGCGTTDLSIALPKCPSVLEWIGVGNVVIEKNARVLHFPEKREPVLGLNSDFHAQAVQHIKVACVREAGTQRALQAITILAANVKPARQDLVEFGNGK